MENLEQDSGDDRITLSETDRKIITEISSQLYFFHRIVQNHPSK